MTATSTCPETTDGAHIWDTVTIPGRVHTTLGGRITTIPTRTVAECLACQAQEPR